MNMNIFKGLLLLLVLSLAACKSDKKAPEGENAPAAQQQETPPPTYSDESTIKRPEVIPVDPAPFEAFSGTYYTDNYPFNEWRSLILTPTGNQVRVQVTGPETNGQPLCRFNYLGIYRNGRIEIALQQVENPPLITVQRTKEGEMYINAEGPREDTYLLLELFCQAYTSIGGYYRTEALLKKN